MLRTPRTLRHLTTAAALTLTATAGPALAGEQYIEKSQDYGNHHFGAGYAFDLGYSTEASPIEAGGGGAVYARLFGSNRDLAGLNASAAAGAGGASADAEGFLLGWSWSFGLASDSIEHTIVDVEQTFFSVSTTFAVGPVPVTVGGAVTGGISLTAEAGYAESIFGLTFTPAAHLTGTASASVGGLCLTAGVEGELNLIEVEAPLSVGLDIPAEEVSLTGEIAVRALSGAVRLVANYCLGSASLDLIRWDAAAEVIVPLVDYVYSYGSGGDEPLSTCPLGSFDGANCFVATALAGTTPFVDGRTLRTTPREARRCAMGNYDGMNCYVATPAEGTSPFIYEGRHLMTTPLQQRSCPVGGFDGMNCFVARPAAGTSPFIYEGGLYTTPLAGGSCPVGGFDGMNCFVAPVPAGTSPFIYDGGLYTTPRITPTCPIGSFDGANCYVATAPAGMNPFTYEGHLYLSPIRDLSCPLGTLDGESCLVAAAPLGTDPWIYEGRYLMTTPR